KPLVEVLYAIEVHPRYGSPAVSGRASRYSPARGACRPAGGPGSGVGEPGDDRRQRVQRPLVHDQVGEAPALPPLTQRLDHRVGRPDQQVRRLQDLPGRERGPAGGELLGGLLAIVGDDDALDQGVELDLLEAWAGLLADPGDALVDARRGEARDVDLRG